MKQQTLFDTGMLCDYCKTDPGIGSNGNLFNGFFDHDTKQNVCWGCRDKHYSLKEQGDKRGMFSEMPLVVNLQLHLKNATI